MVLTKIFIVGDFFCYLDIGLKPSNALFVRKKYRLVCACVSLVLFKFASLNHHRKTTKNSATRSKKESL